MLFSRTLHRWRYFTPTRTLFSRGFGRNKASDVGLFGHEVLKTPAGFRELNKNVKAASLELVQRIEKGDTSRTTVQLFDDLSNEICVAADLVECVRQMHADPTFRQAADESAREFCELVESLNTYTVLYRKLRDSKETEKDRLNEVDLRTIELFLDDFQQSGVHLPTEERSKFVDLSGQIFDASARFQWQCDRDIQITNTERDNFKLRSTMLHGTGAMSPNRDFRKFAYGKYMNYCTDQEENLRALIGRRHELAKLTGFPSFAHRAQYNSLLGAYEPAKAFLTGIIERLRPSVERELAVLHDVARQLDHTHTSIGDWDMTYLTNTYKDRAFGTDFRGAVSQFMTLGNLINGFSRIVDSLYGVRFEFKKPEYGEIWDGSIIKMDAHRGDRFLGTIYIDYARRNSKAVGDCHYTVRCSKELASGDWQTPIVVLSLSISDVAHHNWKDVSVPLGSAENLFHELGHAMHSMLGHTRYQHVAGTRCPQDMAEIPSNLMEYFFNNVTVLQKMLTNGNERISIDHAATMIASRFAFTSLEIVQQAAYALFDLELHGPEMAPAFADRQISSCDLFNRITSKALPGVEKHPEAAFHHRFHHLVQYGAKYYSYLVARSAASLIWTSEFQANPLNREMGVKWAEVQSHGGGIPSAQLLSHMLGYTPNKDDLTKALEVETSNIKLEPVNI